MTGVVAGVPVAKLVQTYIRIREARAKRKKEFDVEDKKLEEQLATIKRGLLDLCKEEGVDSMRTENGTFYRQLKRRYWTSDWEAMHRFVIDNKVPELLEKRINQTEIKALLEEQPELVPPGLNVDSEYTISVRKK